MLKYYNPAKERSDYYLRLMALYRDPYNGLADSKKAEQLYRLAEAANRIADHFGGTNESARRAQIQELEKIGIKVPPSPRPTGTQLRLSPEEEEFMK